MCLQLGLSILPASRCSCRLDGVDPESGGDVPERLHRLLVRLMVVLHLADEPERSTLTHTQAGKTELKELKVSPVCCLENKGERSAAEDGRG